MVWMVAFENRNGDSIFPRFWSIVLGVSKTKILGIAVSWM